MSEPVSDLKRVLSASGVYALAAIAQRGLAFFLLPVYTYYIDPAEFGIMELLASFSTVVFGCLMLGQPSAIMKCYHRDCDSPEEKSRVLATALWLDLPVLLGGGALLLVFAETVSRWLIGTAADGDLVRLVVVTGWLTSVIAVVLASLRTRERAVAFSVLSLTQFVAALGLNIVLVVHYEMGLRGVLWGNLISNALALPLALAVARRGSGLALSRRLVAPMLRFGLLLIPVVLTGWVINLSDRYILRLFTDLQEIAVYGVGYKLGLILELAVVWPFQLAWPAVSFSISHREGHRRTYAQALTYLTVVLAFLVLAVSILSRVGLLVLVGEGYRGAYVVVPWVALAYAFNGIQYCVSPGIHISGRTRFLTLVSVAAAVLNLGLNFLLIPRWGMLGAAWATAAAFLLVAAGTAWMAERYYRVGYEYGRLAKVLAIGVAIYLLATRVGPELSAFSVAWHLGMGLLAFPLALLMLGFFEPSERQAFGRLWRRYAPFRKP